MLVKVALVCCTKTIEKKYSKSSTALWFIEKKATKYNIHNNSKQKLNILYFMYETKHFI